MANSLISTVVHDGQRNVLLSVTGILDTSDVAVTDITTIASLTPAPQTLRLDRIFFAIEDVLSVMLWWHATSDALLMPLAGRGHFNYDWFGGYTDPKAAGFTGNIRLSTTGWVGVKHFSLLLELVKQGV